MSDNVRSYGFIAVLKEPVGCEEFFDRPGTGKAIVSVNCEGTLAYIDFNLKNSYSERENIYGLFIGSQKMDISEFYHECGKYGLFVDPSTTQPYNCIWYNGADSDMAMLTKEEFLAQ